MNVALTTKIVFVSLSRCFAYERQALLSPRLLLMANSTAANLCSARVSFFLLLTFAVVLNAGCGLFGTHKKVQVPQLLTPLSEATRSRLITEVNRLARVHSLHGKVDIEFEDTSFAESGIAEKYRQADGTVTLQRPGQIYLIIAVPFIAKDIAQMTSNGETFRVAVLQGDEKYRRFVKGTNSAVYEKLDADGTEPDAQKPKKNRMNEKQTVSALSNLRPQHLTDALMISAVSETAQSGLTYVQSEFYQEESDTRPEKKGARIVRGYYLLEEFSQPATGDARLLRRFWFDRVNGIRLTRIQSFDENGLLTTDVSYWDEKPFGESGLARLPARIEITRPHDHYKLSITYQTPTAVEIDKEYRPEAFVLENRWQLSEVDLDARQRNKAAVTPK
jgi:competence protein ComGC